MESLETFVVQVIQFSLSSSYYTFVVVTTTEAKTNFSSIMQFMNIRIKCVFFFQNLRQQIVDQLVDEGMELSMQIIITRAQFLCLSKLQTHCIFPRAFNVMIFSCCVFFFAVISNFHVHVMLEILFLVLLLFLHGFKNPTFLWQP